MTNMNPLVHLRLRAISDDANKRFVSKGLALFRSLEAMPWPLFVHSQIEGEGMSPNDRAILKEHGIYNDESLREKMIHLYDDARSYLIAGAVDPCVCAEFMRKASALVPELEELAYRTMKLLPLVQPEPNYAEDAKKLFDDFHNYDAVMQRVDDDSFTHYYGEAYDFFWARYMLGNGVEKSEMLTGEEDFDNMILTSVNDYWRNKMRNAVDTYARERVEGFGYQLNDFDDSIELEIQIIKRLADDEGLEEYDREIDWQHLQDYGDFANEDIAKFQFNLNEAKVFQAQRAKEFADAEEQRRADAERRSMPETAA